MAPSSSKFYLRVAHKRPAMLEWHFPLLNSNIAIKKKRSALLECPSFSTFCPKVAQKVCYEWHLPRLNFSSGASQKVCYLGMAPSSSKCHHQVAHKWAAVVEWLLPPLNFTRGWLTKGLPCWNGTFLLQISPSDGSQKV